MTKMFSRRARDGDAQKGLFPAYLALLGIVQTCRLREKSFFGFSMSGGLDIDALGSGKRLRISKPEGSPPTPGG